MPAVVGVFPARQETDSAIDGLIEAGVDTSRLGVVWREKSVPTHEEVEVIEHVDDHEDAAKEAKKGALGGALGGGVAGIGGMILLGTPLGPLLAVGTLGAVSGSITGGLIGALLGAADHGTHEVVHTETLYRDVIERDGFVLTVAGTEADLDRLSDLLIELGASDVSVLREQGEHRRTVTRRHDESDD